VTETYAYDAHGNMTAMSHLSLMQWDFKDHLNATSRQVMNDGTAAETTYYVYDGSGIGVTLERETLHVMDDKQRIALIETRTQGSEPDIPEQLIRCQLGNHLGLAILELDDQAQIISYAEYYPYGSTSYQAGRSAAEVSLKRYRYTRRERDGETGFAHHRTRYYAAWLGRWTSCDPIGINDGVNIYSYVRSALANRVDPEGTNSQRQVQDLIEQTQKSYARYVQEYSAKGIKNGSDLGRAAAAAVQKDFQAVFGKEGVAVFEISFAEGNGEVIDLALHDYKILGYRTHHAVHQQA
jgi:RHS repeat-associated protein